MEALANDPTVQKLRDERADLEYEMKGLMEELAIFTKRGNADAVKAVAAEIAAKGAEIGATVVALDKRERRVAKKFTKRRARELRIRKARLEYKKSTTFSKKTREALGREIEVVQGVLDTKGHILGDIKKADESPKREQSLKQGVASRVALDLVAQSMGPEVGVEWRPGSSAVQDTTDAELLALLKRMNADRAKGLVQPGDPEDLAHGLLVAEAERRGLGYTAAGGTEPQVEPDYYWRQPVPALKPNASERDRRIHEALKKKERRRSDTLKAVGADAKAAMELILTLFPHLLTKGWPGLDIKKVRDLLDEFFLPSPAGKKIGSKLLATRDVDGRVIFKGQGVPEDRLLLAENYIRLAVGGNKASHWKLVGIMLHEFVHYALGKQFSPERASYEDGERGGDIVHERFDDKLAPLVRKRLTEKFKHEATDKQGLTAEKLVRAAKARKAPK